MGRPRQHDERTAAALLDAAERMIESDGIGALTLREVARRADTTTRAVYSVFGSKEALLGALGTRSFELLTEGLRAIVVANRRPRQPTRRSLPSAKLTRGCRV